MSETSGPAVGLSGEGGWTWRCLLLGHAFYWLDVNRRHHCRRCGVTDRRFVLQNQRIRTINARFGCDCPECVTRPTQPNPTNTPTDGAL